MDGNASKNGLRLMGVVVDEKSRGVSGAEVYLDDRLTRTLFDGSFVFEKLVPGSYELKLKLDGFQEKKLFIQMKGDDVNMELMMEPKEGTGKIMGFVMNEESGLPPEGGTVLMILPTNNKYVRINPEDGYYEFNNIAAGFYTITTSILEYEEVREGFQLAEGEEKRIDFKVKKEEEKEVPWG